MFERNCGAFCAPKSATPPHEKPRKSADTGRFSALHWSLILALPLLVFAVYLFCKWRYYGDILPATYYAKAGDKIPPSFDFIRRGLAYVRLYLTTYWLVLVLPVCVFFVYAPALRFIRNKKFKNKFLLLGDKRAWLVLSCALLVLVQAAYMLRIGGGYLEFRFMAVTAPFLFILIALAAAAMPRLPAAACVLILISASVFHYRTFSDLVVTGADNRVAERLPEEAGIAQHPVFAKAENTEWQKIGEGLARFFAGLGDYPPEVKIAVNAGGYIPFYSRLYALEMNGWADPRLLAEGNHVVSDDPLPGHHFRPTGHFMSELGINLILWHPHFADNPAVLEKHIKSFGSGFILGGMGDDMVFSDDARIVAIPYGEGSRVVAAYITRNETLDNLFIRNNIKMYAVGRREENNGNH